MHRRVWLSLMFALVPAGCGGGVNNVPVTSTPLTSTIVSNGQSILYQVRFVNQSGHSGSVLIVPSGTTAPFANIVWWTAPSPNGSTQTNRWYNSYAAFFARSSLQPGSVVIPGVQTPIDWGSTATLTTLDDGRYPYLSVQYGGQGYNVGSDSTIPSGTYVEGFALNNAPLQAMPAVAGQYRSWLPPALDIGFTTNSMTQGQVLGDQTYDHSQLNLAGSAVTVTYTAAHTFVTSY